MRWTHHRNRDAHKQARAPSHIHHIPCVIPIIGPHYRPDRDHSGSVHDASECDGRSVTQR